MVFCKNLEVFINPFTIYRFPSPIKLNIMNINWENVAGNKRVLFVFLTIVSFFVIFHRLNEAYLGGDDCYYSEVSKEMARTGDYLTPKYNYVKDFHTSKPPMLFWMNALSGKVFSFNNFAMRLPSAILGFIGVISLMFFVSKYLNFYTAFVSGLILTFTQQYLYHSRSAVTDGPFSVFFALSLMSFWVAKSRDKWQSYYLMGFFAGLAVMTRQIPGLFILAVIFAYIFLLKEFSILKNIHFYGGIILSFIVFMPWHIAVYLKYGNEFISQYFNVALMTAFKGYPVEYSGNPSLNPWYAYFQILINNYWPWLPFLVIGLYQFVKRFKENKSENNNFIFFVVLWAPSSSC
ncbi:MAG: glycosyltransferase family 39 protein [Elusimicrobia bacterium]|nr:glycosyltransferase family 39 protein [Candidatus Liberimonas magnetica]